MTDDKVTITLAAKTTDPNVLRLAAGDVGRMQLGFNGLPKSLPSTLNALADALDQAGDITYEPTREHWTPYEPWMRDVLADDARVSREHLTVAGDIREPWLISEWQPDEWLAGRDARIHPDDVPERPVEPAPDVDPDEALASSIEYRLETTHSWLEAARAAREHIAEEKSRMGAALYYGAAERRKREKAEGERDWWRDWWRDELAERWGKSDVDEQTTRFEEAETAMRAEVKDHDATRARAEKAEADLADERVGHNATLIEWEGLLNALADMTRQRDALGRMADHNHDVAAKVKAERDEWKSRHEALRADVEAQVSSLTRHYERSLVEEALDRDAAREPQS